jgi:hypothetical protein
MIGLEHRMHTFVDGDIGLLVSEIFAHLVDDGASPEKRHLFLVLCAALGASL